MLKYFYQITIFTDLFKIYICVYIFDLYKSRSSCNNIVLKSLKIVLHFDRVLKLARRGFMHFKKFNV